MWFFFFNLHLFKISTNRSHWNVHTWLLKMYEEPGKVGGNMFRSPRRKPADVAVGQGLLAAQVLMKTNMYQNLEAHWPWLKCHHHLFSCVTWKNHLALLNGVLRCGMEIVPTSWDCCKLSIFLTTNYSKKFSLHHEPAYTNTYMYL